MTLCHSPSYSGYVGTQAGQACDQAPSAQVRVCWPAMEWLGSAHLTSTVSPWARLTPEVISAWPSLTSSSCGASIRHPALYRAPAVDHQVTLHSLQCTVGAKADNSCMFSRGLFLVFLMAQVQIGEKRVHNCQDPSQPSRPKLLNFSL